MRSCQCQPCFGVHTWSDASSRNFGSKHSAQRALRLSVGTLMNYFGVIGPGNLNQVPTLPVMAYGPHGLRCLTRLGPLGCGFLRLAVLDLVFGHRIVRCEGGRQGKDQGYWKKCKTSFRQAGIGQILEVIPLEAPNLAHCHPHESADRAAKIGERQQGGKQGCLQVRWADLCREHAHRNEKEPRDQQSWALDLPKKLQLRYQHTDKSII